MPSYTPDSAPEIKPGVVPLKTNVPSQEKIGWAAGNVIGKKTMNVNLPKK